MILISKKQLYKFLFTIALTSVTLLCFQNASAQSTQGLSVSPTLFEMTANPEQRWQSTVRIVNPNPYELTVYVTAVNFEPKGEAGDGSLLPILDFEATGQTLAEWIEYSRDPITIPPEKSYDLPFAVALPKDAAPGGHFAAFMVGTLPLRDSAGVSKVRTSQVVTSLFFLRVSGDVTEAGTIREFSTQKTFYQKPEINLDLRFENKGNVHLRPQGDIVISNMWGVERGIIPINHQSHFGNVLPKSTRKFSFSWKSDWSVTDMGRYSAIATLAYGNENRQFVTSTTYFWVIPIVPLASVIVTLIAFVYIISWLVRSYVQKMLRVSGMVTVADARYQQRKQEIGTELYVAKRELETTTPSIMHRTGTSNSILGAGVLQHGGNLFNYSVSIIKNAGRRTFIMIMILVLVLVGAYMYIQHANTPQRSYEVTYPMNDGSVSVTSDEILYEKKRQGSVATASTSSLGNGLTVINSSGIGGLGATVAMVLEQSGYTVNKIDTELGAHSNRTVIVYVKEAKDTALTISPLLNNALLSAVNETTPTTSPITVFVGKDMAIRE